MVKKKRRKRKRSVLVEMLLSIVIHILSCWSVRRQAARGEASVTVIFSEGVLCFVKVWSAGVMSQRYIRGWESGGLFVFVILVEMETGKSGSLQCAFVFETVFDRCR